MRVLVTGATGSLGSALIPKLLARPAVQRIVVFSRDEHKQAAMAARHDDTRMRFYVGDVRDRASLDLAMERVDTVVIAHALKRIETLERNPTEALKTNVIGVQNVVDAARGAGVRKVLLISTDKACEPINVYGISKAMAERLVIGANFYRGPRDIALAAVRYGNVLDSRGSLFWTWIGAIESGRPIRVTDPRMTRFHMTLDRGADFVIDALGWIGDGGRVMVPPGLKSYDMGIFMSAFLRLFPGIEGGEFIGNRGNEKLHEVLISKHEVERSVVHVGFVSVNPEASMIRQYGLDLHEPTPADNVPSEVSSETAKRVTVNDLEADMQAALKRGPP